MVVSVHPPICLSVIATLLKTIIECSSQGAFKMVGRQVAPSRSITLLILLRVQVISSLFLLFVHITIYPSSVCLTIWVCERYVVHYVNSTRLCCAPPTGFVHHRPALCTICPEKYTLAKKVETYKDRLVGCTLWWCTA